MGLSATLSALSRGERMVSSERRGPSWLDQDSFIEAQERGCQHAAPASPWNRSA